MIARLRLLCLTLGILSTVMGCATTPPPMAPLRATLAPAAPPNHHATCNASSYRRPACSDPSAVCPPAHYDG
jgi:hypothetical protein